MERQSPRASQLNDQQFALFVRVQTGEASARDYQQLSVWRRRADFNQRWSHAQDLWDELGFLPEPEIKEIAATTVRWRSLLAIAAVLVVMIISGNIWLAPQQGDHYQTDRGERLLVHFSDGSSAYLGPLSELTVHYSERRRSFLLASGEGFFDVAHDKNRPFVVTTAYGIFEAVGTKFNVLVKENKAELAVVEGVVKVSSSDTAVDQQTDFKLATIGEEAVVQQSGNVAILHNGDVESVAAWTSGQLVFRGESVSDAIEQVNLHSKHRLILRDSALAQKPLYGVFNIGDSQGFVDALKAAFDVRSVDAGDSTLIVPASTTPIKRS